MTTDTSPDRLAQVFAYWRDYFAREASLIEGGYKKTSEVRGGRQVDTTEETLLFARAKAAEFGVLLHNMGAPNA